MQQRHSVKDAFLASVPVMAGYVVLAIGFGMIMGSKGYGVLWSASMSIFIFAGSMQYVGIDLITAGAPFLTIALTTLMVNGRHLFYGISMLEKYRKLGPERVYDIFALTDETYSLVCAEEHLDRRYAFLVSLFDQCYWVGGTILGAVLGSALQFNSEGIDFALTALFLVIFVGQWQSTKNHIPAILGVGVSVICLLVFGPSNFLIPTMIFLSILLMALRKKLEVEA